MQNIGTGFLDPVEERRLIEAHQSGDRKAGDKLFRAFETHLRCLAADYRKGHEWLDPDDLWFAAVGGFLQALNDFDLRRHTTVADKGNGLDAYVRSKCKYAFHAVMEERYCNGAVGEGRAGKWLRGAWDERKELPLEKIARASGVTVETAAESLFAEHGLRDGQAGYDTIGEAGYDFGTEVLGPGIGFDGDAAALPDDGVQIRRLGEDVEDDDPDAQEEAEEEERAVLDDNGLGADNQLDAETGDADSVDDDVEDDRGVAEAVRVIQRIVNDIDGDHGAEPNRSPLYQTEAKHIGKAIAVRAGRYELDCQTFEQDKAAGRAWGTIPPRNERPRAGPSLQVNYQVVRSVKLKNGKTQRMVCQRAATEEKRNDVKEPNRRKGTQVLGAGGAGRNYRRGSRARDARPLDLAAAGCGASCI
jgi:hypothetical protein